MRKIRYSTGLKGIAVIVHLICSVILVLSATVLMILVQKNILDFGNMNNKSFESSASFSHKFQSTASEILDFIQLRKKFETDGKYDEEKVVDIRTYYNNQEILEDISGLEEKYNEGYYLGDLVEWSRSPMYSQYEFEARYYLDNNGIHQQQKIYKNGESVFSEERMISNLGEMTTELQEIIVDNIQHYYGGNYNVYLQNQRTENVTENTMSQEDTDSGLAEINAGATEASAISESMDTGGAVTEADEASAVQASMQLENIIDRVINGELYDLNAEELGLLLRDMNLGDMTSTNMDSFVEEDYLPIGGEGIWEKFMQGSHSVGQMQKEYEALNYTLDNIGNEVNQYKKCLNRYNLTQDGSNVYYWIKRGSENRVYTNLEGMEAEGLTDFGKEKGKYMFYQEQDIRLETNVSGMENVFYDKIEPIYGGKGNILFICVDTAFPYQDEFWEAGQEYMLMQPWIYISIISVVVSGLGCLICFLYLSMMAGRKCEAQEGCLCLIDKIPTEILFVASTGAGILAIILFGEIYDRFEDSELAGLMIITGVATFISMAFFMLFYLSFVRRIRAGVLWSGSITHWFISGIRMMFDSRKSATKMIIWFGLHLLACVVIIPLLMISYDTEMRILGVILLVLLCGVEAVMIIREGVQRNKVLEGINKISSGDLEYKIAEEELKGDNRKLAEAVNMIGDGLFHAVDASMKNERLKADLITNVSHDIKTPLTSIINYVDLLKREDIQSQRAQNYIAVLDSKSQRLKQLTEDLVEASKISSGNITLQMERINFVELVYQTGGEFNEKFEARGLTAITKMPKEPVIIMADGRRIWRVIENLYNNVAKYAMPNTRVYVDMEADGERVQFSIKNISENALNIQADELTERFIRGDVSRSTEGSGLGLSIARNLTTLMGGEFEIYLDGDLFKATISFKQEPVHYVLEEETENSGNGAKTQ